MLGNGTLAAQLAAQIRETRDIAVRAETKADSHVVACIEHNKRVEDMLTALNRGREEQHQENQQSIAQVHARVNGLSRRIMMMIITALGTMVVASFGALYAIFSHKLGLSG